MNNSEPVIPFDWKRFWIGDEVPVLFLAEILLRTGIMFLAILLMLRLLGKRSVRQLSFFELALSIAVGEAAGEPMFHEDVPILHAFAVFAVLVVLYRAVTYLSDRNRKAEILLEGKSICVLENGELDTKLIEKTDLSHDEFFAELRKQQVEHLGQVRRVYVEASGDISVFFFTPEDTRPGLPILPEFYTLQLTHIPNRGSYACTNCAHVEELLPQENYRCSRCRHPRWLPVLDSKRVN